MRKMVLGLLFAVLPALAFGQTTENSWDNLKQLRAGQKIEVVDMNLKSLKGTFVSFSEEAIALRMDGDDVAMPRTHVVRVSEREQSKRARNALIGMSIGVGLGVALGLATKEHHPLPVPLGLFVGSTVAGAGVGAAFPGYRTIYRAPKREPASAR